jgi:hypothetical protein
MWEVVGARARGRGFSAAVFATGLMVDAGGARKEMAAGIATSRHYAATLTQIHCGIYTGVARRRIAVLSPESVGSARRLPKTGIRFGLRLGLA